MGKQLQWHEIEKTYPNQWIQLVDFEWAEGNPRPTKGVVRINASDRREFNRLVLDAEPVDAARVYVGSHNLPHNMYMRSNIVKMSTISIHF
jgi:hypothetical protein